MLPIFEQIITLVLVVSLIVACIGGIWRCRLWLTTGRPAEVSVIKGLLSVPKRYFVDLHHVVARDRFTANMHVLAAGGFLSAMIIFILIYGGQITSPELRLILMALLGFTLIGGLMDIYRRRFHPQAKTGQLSKGVWQIFPLTLVGFSAGALILQVLAFEPLPGLFGFLLGMISTILTALCLFYLVALSTWRAPLKHAFAGTLNLAFHPRPDRFSDEGRSVALRPLDLDQEDWGVKSASDFSWNRLLNFDACVQCGRCEAVCPAYAAGQPLNPKKLIQDMVDGFAKTERDQVYAGNDHPNQDLSEGLESSKLISDDTLWSCTTCRACVQECPMMIEHVDAVIDMRRSITLETGDLPGQAVSVLEEIRLTDNAHGVNNDRRFEWASDLNLSTLDQVKTTDILLWAGEGAFELRNQQTLRILIKLLQKANVDFAVLGAEELDTGDTARRLGDEATFQNFTQRNKEILGQYSFNRILTADPHVYNCLKNDYAAMGVELSIIHHTQFLAELVQDEKLKIRKKSTRTITYHDPCYLGRYNGEFQAPRWLLSQLGSDVVEMERSKERSRCCGGGGGAPITDIQGERRIPDMRMADVQETGAQVVAAGCPQCTLMLEGVVQPRPAIKDIAELLWDAVNV